MADEAIDTVSGTGTPALGPAGPPVEGVDRAPRSTPAGGLAQVGLGLVALAVDLVDELLPDDGSPGLRRAAAIGAGAVSGCAAVVSGAVDEAARTARRVPGASLLAIGPRLVGRGLDHLAARGAAELASARPAARHSVDRARDVVLPPVVDAVLPVALERLAAQPDALLGVVAGVVPPVLDDVLPEVLDRLLDDPAAILALVEVLLPPVLESVLPLALERLAAEPEALRQVVGPLAPGLLDDILPVALAQLEGRDRELVQLVTVLLPALLDQVLPVALAKLAEDPEVVRNLVLDQSGGLAEEMANVVRARTVTADDAVERLARRLTFRKPRPPAGPLASLPAGPAPEDGR